MLTCNPRLCVRTFFVAHRAMTKAPRKLIAVAIALTLSTTLWLVRTMLPEASQHLYYSESLFGSRLAASGEGKTERASFAAAEMPRKPRSYAEMAGVQCPKLLQGDAAEISKAKAFIAANASTLRDQADAMDNRLASLSCEELLSSGYAKAPASRIEAEFPLAFGLRFHQRPAQAELLLRTIYAPQNLYCLHIDPKANPLVMKAMSRISACLPNVHIVVPLEQTFVYGSISPLLADIACMKLLTAHNATKWRYFINLTGQELPLKTNYELVRLLMLYNGSNEIESEPGIRFKNRYQTSYWCRDANDGRSVECPLPRSGKPQPPRNVTIYKGLAYGFFSRSFVEFVLVENGFAAELLRWFSDTYSPDENYWATLNRLPGVPGSYPGPESLPPMSRAVVWLGYGPCRGITIREICIFSAGDLPWLLSRHEAFANKFLVDYDPIAIECLAMHVARSAAKESGDPESWLVPWYWSAYLQIPQIQNR